MASTFSLSNEFSKEFGNERTSLSDLYFGDAENREIDSISNERIAKGEIVLETYEVLSDPFLGGMGSVWRVHHQSWNTELAMKRPQPRFFAEGGDERKKQFIEECENWINLGLHPNIVSCYYVREIGGVPTTFSEWMDNGSLKDRIADGSLYEGTEQEVQERILDIAIQAARGLQYSHENGLIHQDMKPGNLLLSKDWDAKVADFGLAKAKEQLEDKSNIAKTTGYTLAYCPKEQSEGEEPQKWMDIYAWALTVLEMYAGKRLWQTGAETKEYFDEYLSQCEHSIPGEMQTLLRFCLTDKPEGLYEIIEKMLSHYSGYFGTEYRRFSPDAELLTADSNNNYAMSMIELDNSTAAGELWEAALKSQPDHVPSRINKTFYDLLTCSISYEKAYKSLEKIPIQEDRQAAIQALLIEGSGFEVLYEIPSDINNLIIHDYNRHTSIERNVELFSLPVIFDGVGHYYLLKEDKLYCYDFEECTSLESVTLPDGLRSIRHCAFSGCTALKHITIPSGVTRLEESAFQDCGLQSVTHCGKTYHIHNKEDYASVISAIIEKVKELDRVTPKLKKTVWFWDYPDPYMDEFEYIGRDSDDEGFWNYKIVDEDYVLKNGEKESF